MLSEHDEDLIEQALALLGDEIPSSGEAVDPDTGEVSDTPLVAARQRPSPTLAQLEPGRRPKLATVCETCPHSVWFATPSELRAYCRVMYLVVWSSKEPNQLTHCDGAVMFGGPT